MKYESQKIALVYFAVALALLHPGAGRAAGGWIYVAPNTLSELVPFNIVRMLHTNSLIVWLLLGFFGAAYFLLPEEAEREIHSPTLAYVQLAILVLGTLAVVVTYVFDLFHGHWLLGKEGREFIEQPQMGQGRDRRGRADLPLQRHDDGAGGPQDRDHQHPAPGALGPGAVVPLQLLQPLQPGARQAVLVVHRASVGGGRLGADHGLHPGLPDAQADRRRPRGGGKWLYVIVAAALFSGILGTGHHYYWIGTPGYWQWIGSIFSSLEVRPLLRHDGLRLRHGVERPPRPPEQAALLWSLGCATLAFFGAGVWGFLHTLHGVNFYTHGTQITAAHGHLAFFGAYVSLNLAIMTYAMPILKGRDPYNQVLNMASFWLMAGGMTFMTFVLTFAGTVQTHLQRVMGMDYMSVQDELAIFFWMRVRRGRDLRGRCASVHLRHLRAAARNHRAARTGGKRRAGRVSAMDGSTLHENGATAPFYLPQGQECAVFEAAFQNRLPLLLKGPTGCGKTRFVAHMAARLGRPLHTVACHDDLTAADLVGRYLLKGGETVWVDGPLTRAVREGAICYLDEVVEAAQGRHRRPAPADR